MAKATSKAARIKEYKEYADALEKAGVNRIYARLLRDKEADLEDTLAEVRAWVKRSKADGGSICVTLELN